MSEFELKSTQFRSEREEAWLELEQLVATCQGEFLEGLTIPGEKIDDWLHQQRNRFEFALIDILKRLVDQQVAAGEFEPAAIHAEKLVSLDPLNEAGHRALMSIYASLGQQHRILRQYQLCCQALESSQVLEPSEDTKSLFQQLYHETSVKPLFEITAPADIRETVSIPPPAHRLEKARGQ